MSGGRQGIAIRGRTGLMVLGAVAAVAVYAVASHDSSDPDSYLSEDRCQPVDDMSDPGDGYIPSPDELLPDPEACPEFYEGNEDAVAPPIAVDPGGGSEPVTPPAEDPCASGASLNGFPCTNGPNGPIYITPDPSYPDY
ncbi:MAG: hypothetical protein KDB46_13385 [Solirubrobacterales bacterium]|nr:hypothetical protein [Solirubrobacterales bacterium]